MRSFHRSAILVVLGVFAVGCSPSAEPANDGYVPGAAESAGLDYRLDYSTQHFSDPVDELALTWEEESTLNFAAGIALAACMEEAGTAPGPVYDRRKELSEMADRSIGVWSEEYAAAYGYMPPPDSDGKLALLSADNGDAYQAVKTRCRDDKDYVKFAGVAREYTDELKPRVEAGALSDPAAEAELDDKWRSCLDDHSVSIPDEDYVPRGLGSMSKEEEIRIALIDVDCKATTGYVESWAEYSSDLLAPAIELHRSEIDDFRKRAEPVIEEAREVIREYES